jgi:hypothetical protein
MGVGFVVVQKAAGGPNPEYANTQRRLSGIFGKAFPKTGL